LVEVINLKNIRNHHFFVDENKVSIGAVGKIRHIYTSGRLGDEYPDLSIEFGTGDLIMQYDLYSENIKPTKKKQTFCLLFPKVKKVSGYLWYVFWITNKAHNPSFEYKFIKDEGDGVEYECENWADEEGRNKEYYMYGYFKISCPPKNHIKKLIKYANDEIEYTKKKVKLYKQYEKELDK